MVKESPGWGGYLIVGHNKKISCESSLQFATRLGTYVGLTKPYTYSAERIHSPVRQHAPEIPAPAMPQWGEGCLFDKTNPTSRKNANIKVSKADYISSRIYIRKKQMG